MRNSNIDFFKTISIFAIITLHSSPFHGYKNVYLDSLDIFFNQITRFAVPYFFIIAGYFYGKKLKTGMLHSTLFRTYFNRLFPLFCIWSFIYIILPTDIKTKVIQNGLWSAEFDKITGILSNPITLFFEGGRGHLWFIMSLIMAMGIVTIFSVYRKEKWMIPFSFLLYIFGIIAGSYAKTPIGITVPFNTVDGPFFSSIFVAIGFYLASDEIKIKPNHALTILLIGFAIHFFELYLLWNILECTPPVGQNVLG